MDKNTIFRERVATVVNDIAAATELLTAIGDDLDAMRDDARDDKSLAPATLGLALFRIAELYDAADRQVKRLYHFKDFLNKNLVPDRMRTYGMDGFRVPEIARSFSIVEKTSASFIDKDAGLEWLREIGQGDMIQETVNAGTLSSFCRNMLLEEGREPPEGVVKMTTYDTTSVVKYRPKAGEL